MPTGPPMVAAPFLNLGAMAAPATTPQSGAPPGVMTHLMLPGGQMLQMSQLQQLPLIMPGQLQQLPFLMPAGQVPVGFQPATQPAAQHAFAPHEHVVDQQTRAAQQVAEEIARSHGASVSQQTPAAPGAWGPAAPVAGTNVEKAARLAQQMRGGRGGFFQPATGHQRTSDPFSSLGEQPSIQ